MLNIVSTAQGWSPDVVRALPYVLPYHTPLYYANEDSGRLKKAVLAYLRHTETPVNGRRDSSHAMSAEDFVLVVAICDYVIHAPCWSQNPHADAEERAKLRELRAGIKVVDTPELLTAWLYAALELGIDPL